MPWHPVAECVWVHLSSHGWWVTGNDKGPLWLCDLFTWLFIDSMHVADVCWVSAVSRHCARHWGHTEWIRHKGKFIHLEEPCRLSLELHAQGYLPPVTRAHFQGGGNHLVESTLQWNRFALSHRHPVHLLASTVFSAITLCSRGIQVGEKEQSGGKVGWWGGKEEGEGPGARQLLSWTMGS